MMNFSQRSNCLSKMPDISLDSLATLLSLIILQALFWHCCPTLFLWHDLYEFFDLFDVRFLMFATLFDRFNLLLKKINISDVKQNGVLQQWILLISIKYVWNFSGNKEKYNVFRNKWNDLLNSILKEMCYEEMYSSYEFLFSSYTLLSILCTTKICVAKAIF